MLSDNGGSKGRISRANADKCQYIWRALWARPATRRFCINHSVVSLFLVSLSLFYF